MSDRFREHPPYAAALDRLAAIHKRQADVAGQVAGVDRAIRDSKDAAARRLAAGSDPDLSAIRRLQDQLDRCRLELQLLAKAIEIAQYDVTVAEREAVAALTPPPRMAGGALLPKRG